MSNLMDKPPEVSVVLLACNHARYIAQSIESVLQQANDAHIEILIGDDASTDGTSEIVAAYAVAYPRLIQHIRRFERIGGSANYIDLLVRARGEFIAYLDGDDYWLPGKLKHQLKYIYSHQDCSAVYTNAFSISESGVKIGVFNDYPGEEIHLSDLLRRGNFLCNSSMLFRKHLCAAIFSVKGPVLDFRVHLLHASTGNLAQLSDALVGYRVNSSGSMVVRANDLVRELYWQAIQSVPRKLVTDYDYACGIADFLRRVFFRAVHTRDLNFLCAWIKKSYAVSPYGMLHTTALVLSNVARIVKKMALALLAKFFKHNYLTVLYHY